MIYVYAITDRVDSITMRLKGLGSRPLHTVSSANLAAVCSDHDGHVPAPSIDAARRHETVVERLMEDRAVLPVRYGTTFSTTTQLSQSVASHRAVLQAGLDLVRGQVELGVRAIWRDAEHVNPRSQHESTVHSGREYMAARLAEERVRQARQQRLSLIADELHQRLSASATSAVYRLTAQSRAMFAGAYLIPSATIEHFRRCVEAIAVARDDLHLLCTGPWPPYHFVPPLHPTAHDSLGTVFA